MRAVGIVAAAGRSERFGSVKALAEIDGMPMLERVVATLWEADVPEVVVVLGDDVETIRERVHALASCRVVVNPHPERGMFSSLQEGLSTTDAADAYVVTVGDLPYVRAETIRALLDEFARGGGAVSPRYRGKRGHPVVVDEQIRQAVLTAEPTLTFHHILRAHEARRRTLDVDDPGVLRDVDTPADLEEAAT